jgi:hypothetical protein
MAKECDQRKYCCRQTTLYKMEWHAARSCQHAVKEMTFNGQHVSWFWGGAGDDSLRISRLDLDVSQIQGSNTVIEVCMELGPECPTLQDFCVGPECQIALDDPSFDCCPLSTVPYTGL